MQELEAALHAAQLEMADRKQSVHADAAGQKERLKALQEELREALFDKDDAQRQACLPHHSLFTSQQRIACPPDRCECCCQQLCCRWKAFKRSAEGLWILQAAEERKASGRLSSELSKARAALQRAETEAARQKYALLFQMLMYQ